MHSLKGHLLAFVLIALSTTVHSRVFIDPETEQENRCGGALEADSGTVTFPAVGQVVEPGRICIWTIHLQTTSTVRLNFSSLDIVGDDANCEDNAVRLYSLTNLIPADKSESYTFCNNRPPTDGNFYLSGNLVTVVYRSSEEVTNSGTGFTLNWEGISYQPIPKTHESTYTSATSGIIRYPIEGEYSPNQVTTWLIKTSDANPNLQLQITLPYVSLEPCSNALADPCLCDALILYEITSTGQLLENTRLCGNSTGTDVDGLGPNFIVGFFTDHENVGSAGRGFELIYKPRPPPTTTPPPTSAPTSTTGPTTTPPTTTPAPPPVSNVTTACGGVLFGNKGLIEYRRDEYYQNYEKCFWTVRVPNRKSIRFIVAPIDFETGYDNLVFYAVNQGGVEQKADLTGRIYQNTTIIINSTVAIVEFYSDNSNNGPGFSISFAAEGPFDGSVNYYEDVNVVATEEGDVLRYPSEGLYRNLELSTFVFARPTRVYSFDRYRVSWNFTDVSLESSDTRLTWCKDRLHIFGVDTVSNRRYLFRITPLVGACSTDQISQSYRQRLDAVVVILVTDQDGRGNGFEVEWSLIQGNG